MALKQSGGSLSAILCMKYELQHTKYTFLVYSLLLLVSLNLQEASHTN